MEATIHINMDNAAFDGDAGGWSYELSRILARLAKDIKGEVSDDFELSLRDANGNKVGTFKIA